MFNSTTKPDKPEPVKYYGDSCGPDHPDFNDYGFVSSETNIFFERYMERTSKLPEWHPTPRVKTAAKRKGAVAKTYSTKKSLYDPEEERKLREKKEKNSGKAPAPSTAKSVVKTAEKSLEKNIEKSKAKSSQAPKQAKPLDFNALLQLAEKNSSKPVEKAAKKPLPKKKSPEGLMTAREKLYQEQRAQRERERAEEKEKQRLAAIKKATPKEPPPDKWAVNEARRAAAAVIFAKSQGKEPPKPISPRSKAKAEAAVTATATATAAGATSKKNAPKPSTSNRGGTDNDDDEYDSDMDDFIDDSDCTQNVSSHIRNIFGYDKRKYRDEDTDADNMESSYAQMQREEYISKKEGLKEDLEDMRKEQLEKQKKKARKAKK